MYISIFDLFSITIGPSSSHTVGPMRAARNFVMRLYDQQNLNAVTKIQIDTYGSLALTGVGHGTDNAILMGLECAEPETVDPNYIKKRVPVIFESNQLNLCNLHKIQFDFKSDFHKHDQEFLPHHSNAMKFTAYNQDGNIILAETYYSIGGGFVTSETELLTPSQISEAIPVPFPFDKAKQLLQYCTENDITIAQVCSLNEQVRYTADVLKANLLNIAEIMRQSIKRGCETEGVLPGGLNIKRRAPMLYQKLMERGKPKSHEDSRSFAWLNAYALAVAEENAAGGRIVTAPTNGAAGVVPAILNYYCDFYDNVTDDDIVNFLLTAGTIGILFKKSASISGAEVGCQGEIGVACSMAAGALTEITQGTPQQVENAAEIAMEHHLGLTCDPVAGLVQVPCIERNAMAAVKAANASYLALIGNGSHFISLDHVIKAMLETGRDMNCKYKETALGGLAVNEAEC